MRVRSDGSGIRNKISCKNPTQVLKFIKTARFLEWGHVLVSLKACEGEKFRSGEIFIII